MCGKKAMETSFMGSKLKEKKKETRRINKVSERS
jgi:hypothetical protein